MAVDEQQARTAALALLCAIEDACAERLVPVPGGVAVLDAAHPALYDANHLRIEAEQAPDPDALVAAATALGVRAIDVNDAAVGAALEAPLRERGYTVQRDLLMVLDGQPAAPRPVTVEVPNERLAASRRAASADDFGTEIADQFVSRDRLVAAAVRARSFAVLEGDEVVARCQLFGAGATMQVEYVYTEPTHRRRGLAGALVAHAAREARAAGAEIVFLFADPEGEAARIYRRLGFADTGVLLRYREAEPDADASSQSSSPASSSEAASRS